MSRGKWLAVVFFLLLAGLAGGALWLRLRPAGETTFTNPASAGPNPAAVAERVSELANPFAAAPCFVAADNTCQQVFFHPADYGPQRLELRPFVSPGRQSAADLFFAYGRMLTASGSLVEYYGATRPPELANQQYVELVRALPEKSWANQLNPAFVYAVLDQVSAAALAGGGGGYSRPPELVVDQLGQSYQEGRSLLGTGSADALIQVLETLAWSPEAKALAYALAKNFSADTVLAILAEPGGIEQRYLQLFSGAAAIKRIEFSSQALDMSAVYQPAAGEPFLTALCYQRQAKTCRAAGEVLSCSPAPWLTEDCYTSLLNL